MRTTGRPKNLNPMKKTFTQFLRTRRKDDNGIGDFARDWFEDRRGKPRGYKHSSAIRNYLISMNACQACIDAAERAWREWKNESLNSAGSISLRK